MPDSGLPPSPQDLQFQHAEPIAEAPAASASSAQTCVACKQPTGDTYYHAQGQVVCPPCAYRIENGQQAPPPLSLIRAALYGGAAALGGCTLYALVAIVLHAEIGLIAILVGWMVGKAIRHASYGLGGRPQQILAVTLTYFAITTSYIPVILYQVARNPRLVEQRQSAQTSGGQVRSDAPAQARPQMSLGAVLIYFLMLAAVAPFLSLTSGIGGWISLFIIFIGLQRAWKLTERSDILLMGPYRAEAVQ
jgi:hypothetical protein